MLDKELIKQIRRIQIYTNRAVNEAFAGEYESTFKGRGMQFDEVREYTPGDDVRSIDWNVTARTGRPHIKRFVEERELTVMLLVDLSASGEFGSTDKFKNEMAAELCAVLAYSAIKNNDKVGLITFTDRIERFIPPKKGSQHVLRVIRELLCHDATHRTTDIGGALDYLARVMRKRAIVFLVSDFLPTNNGSKPDDGLKHNLALLNKRHDLISVVVRDRRERHLPRLGLVELEDAETGRTVLVDTNSRGMQKRYGVLAEQFDHELHNMLRGIGVDAIDVATDRPFTHELVRFFKMREKRR
ncbi:MAG: DUF58 domain-containing protein [Sedimentisphaerales bacterium]|nr:DUF58 domain-containing protein [Sedimentisphaerales bacterium]